MILDANYSNGRVQNDDQLIYFFAQKFFVFAGKKYWTDFRSVWEEITIFDCPED